MTLNMAFEQGRAKGKYSEADEPSLGHSKLSKLDVDYSILSEAVLYRLRRAQLAVVGDFNESLLAYGLRPADFSVLIVVANNTDLKQSDVAEALTIQRANFVAIIDGLENKAAARPPQIGDRPPCPLSGDDGRGQSHARRNPADLEGP